ncbi:MAG: ABC transporter substrate-binding protein [Rhodospirillales bacterium]
MNYRNCLAGFVGGITLAAAVASNAVAAEEVNVGICVSWPGYAMLKVAEEKGLSPDIEYNFTLFEDPIGGHLATAAGQIDVYMCTGDYTPLIAERGTDVANVAFTNPSYGVDHIIFSPGVDADNIKGQKVAAPQAYIGHLLMGLMLESINVQPNEVEWVNLNADEAVGPMMSGDLAAAYLYEPWISKVLANREGAYSAIHTADPEMLKTGIFMDVIYMNKKFIAERRETALAVLKARWDAVQYWHDNTEEVNALLAEFLQWPVEDIGYVIGTNGKFFEGGIYMYDFDEAARVCGALDGDPPFGLGNGSMVEVVTLINEWWVKLGLMENMVDTTSAVDCSLVSDLVASGYRQSISAN